MSVFKVLFWGFLFVLYSGLHADDYKIVYKKTREVGEKYHITGNGGSSEITKTTLNGQLSTQQTSKMKCTIEGVVEVIEIDKKKRASKLKLKIGKLTASKDPEVSEKEVLPYNSEIIVASKGKQTVFLLDGEELTNQAANILSIFISLPNPKVTEDEVFGTKDKKKVGDSWKVNPKMAAVLISQTGIKAEEKNIKGNTKLVKVENVGKSKFLQLKTNMEINGIKLGPAGLDIIKSNMVMEMEGLLAPADAPKSLDPRWSSKKMTMEVVSEAADSESVSMTMSFKYTQHAEMTKTNLKSK